MARRSAGSAIPADFSLELGELKQQIAEHGHPRCFDSAEQYAVWLDTPAADCSPLGFCHDCLPEYQAAMIDAGRCHFQWAVFTVDPEGGVVGRVPHLHLRDEA
jgi:hypothetical protein